MNKKQMDKDKMVELSDKIGIMVDELFEDTDIIDQLLSDNNKELYEDILTDIIIDIVELNARVLMNELNDNDLYTIQVEYVLKYGLFIAKFELDEEYEYCKSIKEQLIKMYKKVYIVEGTEIEDFVNIYIGASRNIINKLYEIK